MLTRDQEHFDRNYQDAAAFMRAAQLRHELYTIAMAQRSQPPSLRSEYASRRIAELLQAPACREPWFVVQLRGDAPWMEEALLRAGL